MAKVMEEVSDRLALSDFGLYKCENEKHLGENRAGALAGTAQERDKRTLMEKQSLTPHFPNYPQARAFLKVLEGIRLGLFRSVDAKLRQQWATPNGTRSNWSGEHG